MKRRTPPNLTLRDFSIEELLSFTTAWAPGDGSGRWDSWAEFLDDYEVVRPLLIERYRTGPRADFPSLFGDVALAFRLLYGAAALDAVASCEEVRYGVAHVDDEAADPPGDRSLSA